MRADPPGKVAPRAFVPVGRSADVEHGRSAGSQAVGERNMVVLVDEAGVPTGVAAKLVAHEPPGRLHLAFSAVLYRSDGLVLLQQRAGAKYHFPLTWGNSCCSHPQPGEDVVESAERRVREELGLDCQLRDVGTLIYRAVCPVSGLVEHEFDHVLVGEVEGDPAPDPTEIARLRWAVAADVLSAPPAKSAPWLVPVLRLAEGARGAAAFSPE
ncbi:MAG: isopentenyl-diphosphate Delta-isomerase [Acidimicrobiales bacterium]